LLKLEEWMDIRSLHQEGHSIKAIARYTGRSRNTVRRVLREAGPTSYRKPERPSRLDPFKTFLRERWEACGLSAVRLLPEIQAMGYTGSISTLRRFLHSLKPERERLHSSCSVLRLGVRFQPHSALVGPKLDPSLGRELSDSIRRLHGHLHYCVPFCLWKAQ
jgi:transposase